MILFIIFIWTSFLQDSFGYILSEGRISWLEAAKIQTQTFATPDIFSLKSFTNLLKDGEEIWVGYFQMNTAFAYVGCTSIDEQSHIKVSSMQNSPGICLTLCKRMKMAQTLVGLSRDKCICLRSLPSSDLNKTGCNLQNKVWVAGDGDKLMSLYEKKDIFGSGETNNVKCLAFDKYSRSAYWKRCRQYNKSFCKTKDGTYIKVNGNSDLPWAEYIKQCFTTNCRPITYEDIQNRTNQLNEIAVSSTWTRVIRSVVTYEYKEINSTMKIRYGYLKRKDKDLALDFSLDGNAKKRALFETLSSNDKTTPMSGSQSSSTTSVLESGPTRSSLSPETLTDETFLKVGKQMDQNSDVRVAIGISVSSVMIVVAIVVIIVTLKRRGKIPTKCYRQAEPECSKNDNNAYEMSLSSPYDQIDDIGLPSERCFDNEGTDNVISGHTYFILQKHTWESDTDDNIENMTKTETSNVYNTLNSNVNKTGSNEAGNTYDTTEKVVTKLKAQHHTNVEDATENTYNHTGSRPVKIGKTDDVYGVLNNVEGE